MNLAARTVLVTVAAIAAVAMWAIGSVQTSVTVKVPPYEPPGSTAAAHSMGTPVGATGCLAAACHGGPAEKTLAREFSASTWQSSGTAWTAADPHTTAYSLLTDPNRLVTAEHIMARYAPGKKATEDARCLACHANPALAETVADPVEQAKRVILRSEGVSCEACHGNAGGWVSQHATWKHSRAEELKAKPDRLPKDILHDTYKSGGMAPLYDIGERSLNCLGCHVGAPETVVKTPDGREIKLPVRDMNHDMIAAGHPRLDFDFAEYLRRLPPHWQEKDRVTNGERPLNPAKVWLVGRAAHAEAACKLLESRADRAAKGDDKTPWPEFAEFNCASCHHNLRVPEAKNAAEDWRKQAKYLGTRPPGVPPWQTIWPMTPAAGYPLPTRDAAPLKGILEAMEKPRPTRFADAKTKAADAIPALAARRSEWAALSDAEALKQAKTYFVGGPPDVPEWDSAGQLLYGRAALERTLGTKNDKIANVFTDGFQAMKSPRPALPDEASRWSDERKRWQTLDTALRTIWEAQK